MKTASRFSYLIDKIDKASFEDQPFKHIYIENFFNNSDFEEIITSDEISVPRLIDPELIEGLKKKGTKL